jgi:neopullulanase
LSRECGCYPREVVRSQLNLIGGHDTARFLTVADGDVSALRLATFLQMTLPGAPCIYYGDEVGLTGEDDPDCRRGFPWAEERWDQGLWEFFRRAVALRRQQPLLRRGAFLPLAADGGALAFLRRDEARPEDGGILVLLNAASPSTLLRVELPPDVSVAAVTDLWAVEAPSPQVSKHASGTTLEVDLPGRGMRAFLLG